MKAGWRADTLNMTQPRPWRTEPLGGFAWAAPWYNAFTMAAALSAFGYSLVAHPDMRMVHLQLMVTLTLAGLLTLLLATHGNRRAVVTSSRFGLSIDAVWVFVAVLLLPFPFMVVSAGFARWSSALVNPPSAERGAKTRLVSYISITAISGFVASLVHRGISQQPAGVMGSSTREVIAVLVSAVVFSLLSNLLTGVAYSLTDSQRLRDQRAGTGVLIEVALLCHGGLAAWAWTQSPAILLLGLPTLVLVQRALMHERLEARANRTPRPAWVPSAGGARPPTGRWRRPVRTGTWGSWSSTWTTSRGSMTPTGT